jgi:hypothetical protein
MEGWRRGSEKWIFFLCEAGSPRGICRESDGRGENEDVDVIIVLEVPRPDLWAREEEYRIDVELELETAQSVLESLDWFRDWVLAKKVVREG